MQDVIIYPSNQKMMEKVLNFQVIIQVDEDGVYFASVPSLPGCHTQGSNYNETIKFIKEAIKLYLEVLKDEAQLDITDLKMQNTPISIAEVPVSIP